MERKKIEDLSYKYFLASLSDELSAAKLCRLSAIAGSAREVYHMTEKQLRQAVFLTDIDRAKILKRREDWDPGEKEEELHQKGIHLITREDEAYPEDLREIAQSPYGIFYKGRITDPCKPAVAIVGARMCSEYGREVAGQVAMQLAAAGVQVISGMAKGVDSAGHFGALRGNGTTFAVLGCGVDICYPPGNRILYEKIEAAGGILSEYPPGTPPVPMRFPMRNRIISGLCQIVIVAEAREKSGSLITADYALEQGKDIYAVPGRMTDVPSAGCNRLIKQGAGILLSVEDFLDDLGITMEKRSRQHTFSKNLLEKEESLVYSVLDLQPKNIEEIRQKTKLTVTEVMQSLILLQKQGMIREVFKNCYIRT